MIVTPAERTRAYRKRKALHDENQHDECLSKSCAVRAAAEASAFAPVSGDGAGDVTRDVTAAPEKSVTHLPVPAGLGPRGTSLWERSSGPGFHPLHLALLEEACRTIDLLDRLHGQLEGGELLELVRAETESDDVAEIRVVVNGVIVERRQQMNNFRLATAELRLAGRTGVAALPAAGGVVQQDEDPGAGVPVGSGEGGLGDLINAAARFRTPAEG